MNLKQAVRPFYCSLILTACLAPAAALAQAVWTNADDRDYDGNGKFVAAYWSWGFEPANPATGFKGHVGNWSGNPYPGTGGVADAYLGAPGNTLCDVQVSLNTLTIAPAGQLTMVGSTSLTVSSTNVQGDGALVNGMHGGGFPIFNNTGTFRKSAGPGAYAIDSTIVFNSLPGSVIQVDSGTLQLPGIQGLLDTVTFNTAAGTVVDLVGDRGEFGFNFGQGILSSGTGVGTVRLRANQLDYNYRQDGASCTFNFPGDVFQWTGGLIGGSGSGEVPLFYNTGVMNLSGDGTKFSEAYITNRNLTTQTGAGNLDIGGVDVFTNAAGATYDLRSDAGIVTTGYGSIANAGLFKKSAGTGTSTINTFFTHQGGTVEVDSGTLLLPTVQHLGTNISTGGTFNVAANALLDLGSGEVFGGTYTGSGAGTVQMSAGVMSLDINNKYPTTFNFPAGLFQWTGGTIGDYAGELFTNAGTINVSGATGVSIDAQFTNAGTIIQTGAGSFTGGGLLSINNTAGALFNLRSDAGITRNGVNYVFNFTNAGTLQKSAGTGTSTVLATFTNTGTVAVQTGTLDFSFDVTGVSGGTLPSGTWTVANGAALTISAYPAGVTVNQATVILNGANAQFPAINGLTDNQGTFSLLTQKQFTTVGALSNEGTITLDAGSTLHVAGNFTASETAAPVSSARAAGKRPSAALVETGSVLHVTIGGTATQGAASAGLLQVAGTAKLAGKLEIALAALAAAPGASDTVTVLAAQAVTGAFSNVAEGARLDTADGKGSFQVNSASSGRVVLSAYLPAGQSEPTTPAVSFVVPGSVNGKTSIAEGGPKLKILASRSGADLSQPLTVTYKVSGPVVSGVDYKPLSGTVTIPAGAATAKIKILAYNDGVQDGTKVLKLKLQPSAAYTFGAIAKAKITILDAQN